MTSDTRALSAFHVVRPDQLNYEVLFESSEGTMWADDESLTQYPASYEHTMDYRCDALEEYPFLANRLFSLGLDPMAQSVAGLPSRKALRTWQFTIETIPAGDPDFSQESYWGQGFMPLLPTRAGKDIVLLKARELDFDPSNWMGSEPFSLTSPSLFFEQTEVAKDKYGFPRKGAELSSIYTSPFIPRHDLVPSACISGDLMGNLPTLSQPVCVSEGNSVSYPFGFRHKSELDSAGGTSGGGILGEHLLGLPPGSNAYRFRQVFGVLSGAYTTSGTEPLLEWGDPDQDPSKFATMFTELGPDWQKPDRDGPHPWNPQPVWGPTDRELNCIDYENQPIEDLDGISASVCVEWGEGDTSPGKVLDGIPINTTPQEHPNPNQTYEDSYFKIQCTTHYVIDDGNGNTQVKSDPGALVGLLGALHFGVEKGIPRPRHDVSMRGEDIVIGGGGIGSFYQVCAPYSSEPFSTNWRFVSVAGNRVDPKWDAMKGRTAWDQMKRALVTKYEQRWVVKDENEVSYIRPPSFKTCPPGKLLHGFDLSKNTDSEGYQYYAGVNLLHCVSPDGKNPSTASLVPSGGTYDYTLFERDFDLTQMIGVPTYGGDQTKVKCLDTHPVMFGLRISHDVYGRLNGVSPVCTRAPQQ